MRVIVANPSRQHSDQMASALAAKDMLELYVHGAPIRPGLNGLIHASLNRTMARYRLAIAASNRLLTGDRRTAMTHRVYAHFGAALARVARGREWSAVICSENSALPIFSLARDRGRLAILDAASVHHRWQARLADPDLDRRNAVKDAEIALADHILTCSQMARDSYIEAGVVPDRVHVLPLGVDLGGFAEAPRETRHGALRFLFIGRSGRAKGADILAAACARLDRDAMPYHLDCVGKLTPDAVQQLGPFATLHGEAGHEQLAEYMRRADVLVHPSRFDSFGLVIPESLACGTPAIVSDMTGAKYMIRDGETGWVIATADVDALHAAMAACITDPARVRMMRGACRAEARGHDWARYRTDAAALVAGLVAQGRG